MTELNDILRRCEQNVSVPVWRSDLTEVHRAAVAAVAEAVAYTRPLLSST